jgi:outer membrane protein OmpA-like peptidoglycan-associated protein
VSGSVGYGFESQFRPEFEIAYRRSTVDKVSGTAASSGNGFYQSAAFMGNLLYDFDTRTGLTPYFGGGVGGALVSADKAGGVLAGTTLDSEEFVLAYQGIVGMSYEISERLDLTADYRYFGTIAPELKTVGGVNAGDTNYANHNFLIGLRYVFGVPRELPEPVTMRQVPRTVMVVPAPVQQRPVMVQPAAPPPPPVVAETYIVFFDFDKFYLTSEAKETIQRAADAFRKGGNAHVEVTGHTDTAGNGRYNKRLSDRRAKMVRDYMVTAGIPAAEINTRGAGESELMVPTADRVREAKNRRAEIILK